MPQNSLDEIEDKYGGENPSVQSGPPSVQSGPIYNQDTGRYKDNTGYKYGYGGDPNVINDNNFVKNNEIDERSTPVLTKDTTRYLINTYSPTDQTLYDIIYASSSDKQSTESSEKVKENLYSEDVRQTEQAIVQTREPGLNEMLEQQQQQQQKYRELGEPEQQGNILIDSLLKTLSEPQQDQRDWPDRQQEGWLKTLPRQLQQDLWLRTSTRQHQEQRDWLGQMPAQRQQEYFPEELPGKQTQDTLQSMLSERREEQNRGEWQREEAQQLQNPSEGSLGIEQKKRHQELDMLGHNETSGYQVQETEQKYLTDLPETKQFLRIPTIVNSTIEINNNNDTSQWNNLASASNRSESLKTIPFLSSTNNTNNNNTNSNNTDSNDTDSNDTNSNNTISNNTNSNNTDSNDTNSNNTISNNTISNNTDSTNNTVLTPLCLYDPNISNICLLNSSNEVYYSFSTLENIIASNNTRQLLKKCRPGEWCLEIDSVLKSMENFPKQICQSSIIACIKNTAEYYRGCPTYQNFVMVSSSIELICEYIRQDPQVEPGKECGIRIFEMITLTLSDMERDQIMLHGGVDHDLCESQKNLMSSGFMCLLHACNGLETLNIFQNFSPWQSFIMDLSIPQRCLIICSDVEINGDISSSSSTPQWNTTAIIDAVTHNKELQGKDEEVGGNNEVENKAIYKLKQIKHPVRLTNSKNFIIITTTLVIILVMAMTVIILKTWQKMKNPQRNHGYSKLRSGEC
ncbi:hypothetical protein Ahia01_000622400 [Argonauta hians]